MDLNNSHILQQLLLSATSVGMALGPGHGGGRETPQVLAHRSTL